MSIIQQLIGYLYRNRRFKTKRKWKELGDATRPEGLNDDDDGKNAIEQWTKEIREEREILQLGDPSTKVNSKSMLYLELGIQSHKFTVFFFSFNRGLGQ